MDDFLDLRTLFLASVIPFSFLGISLVNYAINHKPNIGMLRVGMGLILLATALLMASFSGIVSEYPSTVLAINILWMSAYALFIEGLLNFRKVEANWMKQVFVTLLVILGGVNYYFIYIDYNYFSRVLAFQICLTIYQLVAIYALVFKKSDTYLSKPNLTFGIIYVVVLLYSIAFIFMFLSKPDATQIFEMGLIVWVGRFIDQGLTFAIGIMMFYLNSSAIEKRLIQQSRVDALTQCYNRRALGELAPREIQRANRTEQPVSFIMCDIDRFKRFNDTYGHDVGDEVLRQIAIVLNSNIRKTDILARYGGEEFLIILPNTDINSAKGLAENLRLRVMEHQIESKGTDPLQITSSFGVATHEKGKASWESIAKLADESLYKAKNSGRNCVVSYVA